MRPSWWTTGPAIGGDRIAHAATRNMFCCAVFGQAAGVAGALPPDPTSSSAGSTSPGARRLGNAWAVLLAIAFAPALILLVAHGIWPRGFPEPSDIGWIWEISS